VEPVMAKTSTQEAETQLEFPGGFEKNVKNSKH
jgi:hypothetical protein